MVKIGEYGSDGSPVVPPEGGGGCTWKMFVTALAIMFVISICGAVVGNEILPRVFPSFGEEMELTDRVVEFRQVVRELGEPTYQASDWGAVVNAGTGEPPVVVKRNLPSDSQIDTATWMSLLAGTYAETEGISLAGARATGEITDPGPGNLVASWKVLDQTTGAAIHEGRILAIWIGPDGTTVDAMAFE